MQCANHQRSKSPADGVDIFVVVDGVKIAKRGQPRHRASQDVDIARAWMERARGSLTIAEAATEWGVSTADIRKAIKSGETESTKDEHGELHVATMIIEHDGVRVH
jgi:hypothetical protein